MGLDMYLTARRFTTKNGPWDDKLNAILQPIANQYLPPDGNYGSIIIERDVAYWRKANQIHSWFVTNVQDGNDNCGHYDVSREQLEELRDICIRVRDGTKMRKAKIASGFTYENGTKKPVYEEGEVMVNPELAKELLPAVEGFFFGGTDYNQYYMADIIDTIEQIGRILAWCNAEVALTDQKSSNIDFHYHSSW